jgi:anti-anti-sigma factor
LIETRVEGNVLHLGGRFDAAQVERVEAEIGQLSGAIVLDLAALEYLASAGIAVFVRSYKRIHGQGGTLRVRNVNSRIRDVLRFSGVDAFLLDG